MSVCVCVFACYVQHDKDVVVLAASRQLVGIDVMKIAKTKEE